MRRGLRHIKTHQSLDNVGVMKAVTKHSVEVYDGDSIPEAVVNAFRESGEPPLGATFISLPQDVLMVLTYFTIAAVTGVLTARVRAREKAVRSREERAVALYSLTKDLSSATTQDDVARAAVSNVKKYFRAESAIFLSALDGDFTNAPHPASTYLPVEKELGVPA